MTQERLRRAESLMKDSNQQGITLSLLGGAAVATLCVSARGAGAYARSLGDVDLATTGKSGSAVDRFLRASGLEADEQCNNMNGYLRMRYFDADKSHIDVFIDELRLCHVVSWRRTLLAGMSTLPISLLPLTKLQVVALEAKDRSDLSAVLTDQWESLWLDRTTLARLVGNDWGLWRTGRGTLELLAAQGDPLVRERSEQLLEFSRAIKFGSRARARSVIGDRVRWYEEPEEV